MSSGSAEPAPARLFRRLWPASGHWRLALPLFALLWGGTLSLFVLWLFTVRGHLRAVELAATENLLHFTLHSHSSPLAGPIRRPGDLPPGLVFVRLQQGGEQLLLVAAGREGGEYLALPPELSGVWLPFGEGKERQRLTIISRQRESGLTLQAGKEAGESYRLYRGMVNWALLVTVGSAIPLWFLVLFILRRSLAPLLTTRERVRQLAAAGDGVLLPEEGVAPELAGLAVEINKLLSRNRRLVEGMQQSLDSVAHDLRTPMTRLRSVAEYGLQAEADPERLREALADCLEESERVLAMLRIMMSVAEAEAGTMRLELMPADLADGLKEVLSLYEYVAEESGITVSLAAEEGVPVLVDRMRIGQVWANLLDNALKYGRSGGWVRISLHAEEGWAVVLFADNGIGISATEQPRIWERLYRGDRSRSKPGLGLGLSYVRAVVAAHGGSVAVASELHQGSHFTVRIPIYRGELSLTNG